MVDLATRPQQSGHRQRARPSPIGFAVIYPFFRHGLYQYFINHKGNGQIIIVDNLNVMPDIDLQAAGAKVTTYYKDEKDGHVYGFMPSWRKDLPKETE